MGRLRRIGVLGATLVAGLFAGGLPRVARAGDATAHLAPGAWLIVKAEPEQLRRALAIARLAGVDTGLVAALLSPALGRGEIELVAGEPGKRAGFAAAEPVYLQLRTVASGKARAFRSMRVVLAVGDAPAARAALAKLWQLRELSAADATARRRLATDLGEPARRAPEIVAKLRKAGAFVAGRSGSELVVARLAAPTTIVVDSFAAIGKVEPSWQRDRAVLLGASAPTKEIAALLASPGGRQLTRPGLGVWIHPVRLADAVIARDGHRARCESFRDIAGLGAFEHLGARLLIGENGIDFAVEWALRDGYGLRAALATADDRLAGPGTSAVALTIYGTGLAALRRLARPAAFSGRWEDLWRRVDECGDEAAGITFAFGWPQAIGLLIDEVAALDRSADDALSGLRNIAVAIDKLSPDPEQTVGAAEVSLDDASTRAVTGWLDIVFGARTEHRKPRRHTRWGQGPIRLYGWKRSGSSWSFGAVNGGIEIAARLRRRPGKRQVRPPLARVSADISRVLADLGWSAAGKVITARFGKTARGVVEFRDGGLSASVSLSRR